MYSNRNKFSNTSLVKKLSPLRKNTPQLVSSLLNQLGSPRSPIKMKQNRKSKCKQSSPYLILQNWKPKFPTKASASTTL